MAASPGPGHSFGKINARIHLLGNQSTRRADIIRSVATQRQIVAVADTDEIATNCVRLLLCDNSIGPVPITVVLRGLLKFY